METVGRASGSTGRRAVEREKRGHLEAIAMCRAHALGRFRPARIFLNLAIVTPSNASALLKFLALTPRSAHFRFTGLS
jgi:hypothetical protein